MNDSVIVGPLTPVYQSFEARELYPRSGFPAYDPETVEALEPLYRELAPRADEPR